MLVFSLTFALCAFWNIISVASTIPSEWQEKINRYNAFYAADDTATLNLEGYPSDMYLPLIGNGYFSHSKGVRSDTMFISGVFNGETTSPSHRARIPALFAITIPDTQTTGALLDVENGVYHRRGTFDASPSSSYELSWYAHRSLRSLYILELQVTLGDGVESVSFNLNNNGGLPSEDITFEDAQPLTDTSYSQCGTTKIPETTSGSTTTVCFTTDKVPTSLTIDKSASGKTITYVTAYRTSLDSTEPVKYATADYSYAKAFIEKGTLFQQHVDEWKNVWSSGIEIDGRPDVAVAVNASLFAILSSIRSDWPYGLAPGGLTNYYNGHSFWDTETWMYPPMLFLHPEISQQLLQYRFNRMDGARQKAASYSPPWSGTMFPWESAFSGVETCPTFAATGLREDHINGDIAFAIWQEWLMRQDLTWLKNVGYPMLTGIADFWVSRSTYLSDNKAHILDIIPPDEYVDHVNDSVYSNFVAIKSLQYAVQASVLLNVSCSACAKYQKVANDLVLLYDETLGIHPEYAGYPGNTVKQADVVLLHYPLGLEMNETMQRSDLEFYSTRTDTHGPAMTWGMHAIGYLDLGDYASAAKFFNLSFQDNMHAPLQVWTETPDGNAGNFITGAGGFLQTMISGYPGVRITDEGLTVAPFCPESAKSIKLRSLQYRGAKLDIEYSCSQTAAGQPEKMTVRMVDGGRRPLILFSGKRMMKTLFKGSKAVVDFRKLSQPTKFVIA